MLKKNLFLLSFLLNPVIIICMDLEDDKEEFDVEAQTTRSAMVKSNKPKSSKHRSSKHHHSAKRDLTDKCLGDIQGMHDDAKNEILDYLKGKEDREDKRHWQSHISYGAVISVLVYIVNHFLK